MPRVENYLVFSILVTLLCCLPLGIAAIIKSSQVDKELAIGNYEGALAASKQAKTFNLIGVISGGVFVLIWVVVTFILPLLLAFGL
ncbi:MAG TPA: CD225/dispanin family protein [Clostridiaceae bacterium]|nr:CD225/dispanin family protein [Clostridiaceae bacterium]